MQKSNSVGKMTWNQSLWAEKESDARGWSRVAVDSGAGMNDADINHAGADK